jgi:hypothetical protein
LFNVALPVSITVRKISVVVDFWFRVPCDGRPWSINFKLLLALFSFSELSNFLIESGKIRIALIGIG